MTKIWHCSPFDLKPRLPEGFPMRFSRLGTRCHLFCPARILFSHAGNGNEIGISSIFFHLGLLQDLFPCKRRREGSHDSLRAFTSLQLLSVDSAWKPCICCVCGNFRDLLVDSACRTNFWILLVDLETLNSLAQLSFSTRTNDKRTIELVQGQHWPQNHTSALCQQMKMPKSLLPWSDSWAERGAYVEECAASRICGC